jgi:hypothetical protein
LVPGVTIGGRNLGKTAENVKDAIQTGGESLSMFGEATGILAAYKRMRQDWELQELITISEIAQMEEQLKGAEFQKKAAQQEIAILEQQIEHNASITTFMKDKFSNQQLYQWMIGKLSGIYFQTYKLAHDMARYAEQAFRYERGLTEREVAYIQPAYWDSQRKGLLAGESLGLDLDRMEQAFIESNSRRLEISRHISLLELDPLALLQLKTTGQCEFRLPESLFDYDFQGHYCRQIKTLALDFDMGESGQQVLATLTQLGHQTVLEPDAKAVKYLLKPDGSPPLSIRSDWRASQQIAISHLDEEMPGEENNGVFEASPADERYLPFEGTGAVSVWRLTLSGKQGSYNIKNLTDLVIKLKYTAAQGGESFASKVKGLLKPYETAVMFDLAAEFPEAWRDFQAGDGDLSIDLARGMFPNMSSNKIIGIFPYFDSTDDSQFSAILNEDDDLTLKHNRLLNTSGLSISSRGSGWKFKVKGNPQSLYTIKLVVLYKASVS